MEIIERVPMEKIHYLNSMPFNQFKTYVPLCKNDDERNTQFELMKTFCKTNIKTKGETKRIYAYTQSTSNDVGGRLFCGNSIQGISKKIRGFLLRDTTTDIDMNNAHPVILHYLCKKHDIMCPELEYYINHRNDILNKSGNKDKTKKDFLCAVNSDSINRKNKDEFFKKFDKECKNIQKQITERSEYKHIVNSVPANKIFNWLGSAINRILCVFENKILQEVINFIIRKQIEICCLCFDGLLVYGNLYNDSNFLNELEIYIEEQFKGLNMKFSYKEHCDEIQIPIDFKFEEQKDVEITEGNDYDSIKNEFEKTHCKIINKIFFIKKYENKIIIMKKEQLRNTYEHLKYEEKCFINGEYIIKKRSFILKWFEDENIYYKDDVGIFPPGIDCPKCYYNLWTPFDMEYINDYENNEEAINLFRNHIKILCGNNDEVAEYFEKWIAQMIQYPAIKSVCPTIISREGAGKGTLLQLLEKMLGSEKIFETAEPSRDVWGDFNGLMTNVFLVNLNELSKKETTDSEGRIKKLITDPKLTINNKGISQYQINSYHRFIITTNKEDPIATNKDDRRKFIVRSSDELCSNKAYFNDMYKLLDDVNVIKSCYEYFKSLDVSNFNLIPLPQTEYQNDLKSLTTSPIESWIKQLTIDNYDKDYIELLGNQSFVMFNEWLSQSGIEFKVSIIKFGILLKNLNIDGIEKGKHTNKGETKIFNIVKLKKTFNIGCLI